MKRILLAAAFFMSATNSYATVWHAMGPRAMAMGGSGVAFAQGPEAAYWNPAGLGQLYNQSGISIPFGISGEFAGSVIEGANNLYRLKIDCDEGKSSCTSARITSALDLLGQTGNGAQVDSGVTLGIKIKRIVVFAQNLAYVGVKPETDLLNTSAATVSNNTSKLIASGGSFTELGVGYGREIKETGVIVGANLKGIIGRVGYNELLIVQEDPGAGSFAKFKDSTKTTFKPGVDLGVLWDMRETFPSVPMRPRLGLTARNINAPKFKNSDTAIAAGAPTDFKLQGNMRGGFALSPFKFWHFVADMDLTENLTLIDGRKSRLAGVGTELNVVNSERLNLALRAGLSKNLSKDSDSSVVFTGGVGLNIFHVMFDLGAMVSPKTVALQSETESVKIPQNIGVSARLAFMFGGKDKGARDGK